MAYDCCSIIRTETFAYLHYSLCSLAVLHASTFWKVPWLPSSILMYVVTIRPCRLGSVLCDGVCDQLPPSALSSVPDGQSAGFVSKTPCGRDSNAALWWRGAIEGDHQLQFNLSVSNEFIVCLFRAFLLLKVKSSRWRAKGSRRMRVTLCWAGLVLSP